MGTLLGLWALHHIMMSALGKICNSTEKRNKNENNLGKNTTGEEREVTYGVQHIKKDTKCINVQHKFWVLVGTVIWRQKSH